MYLENVQRAQDVSIGTSNSTRENGSHRLSWGDQSSLVFQHAHLLLQAKIFLPSTHRSHYWVHLKKLIPVLPSPGFCHCPASVRHPLLSRLCQFLLVISCCFCSLLTSSPSRCASGAFKNRILFSYLKPMHVSPMLSAHWTSPGSSLVYESIHFCANLPFCPFPAVPHRALASFPREPHSIKLPWICTCCSLDMCLFLLCWFHLQMNLNPPSLYNHTLLHANFSRSHELICLISPTETWLH